MSVQRLKVSDNLPKTIERHLP